MTHAPEQYPYRQERKPVSLLAYANFDGEPYECVVFNLSSKGCYIVLDGSLTDLDVNQTVVLDFPSYGAIHAVLRWIGPQEAGFEFVVDDPDRTKFDTWIAQTMQSHL